MAYTKTNWVNGTTPINDTNLNHIEQGIYDNDQAISGLSSSKQDTLVGTGTGQNVKTVRGTSIVGTGDITAAPPPVSTKTSSDDDVYSCNYLNGDVLYEDAGTGTNQNITLSANSNLYRFFDIYFHNNDNVYAIGRVPYTTNDTYIATFAATASDIMVKTATITFSGTTLQRVYTREKGMNSTGQTNDRNYIYIDKVIGYK